MLLLVLTEIASNIVVDNGCQIKLTLRYCFWCHKIPFMGVEERRAVPCGATVKTCLSKGIFVLTSRPIASILKGNIFMRGIFFSYIRKSFAEICLNCCSMWCSAKFFDSHKWNVVTSKAIVECQLDLTSIINYYIWGYFRQYNQQYRGNKNRTSLLISHWFI